MHARSRLSSRAAALGSSVLSAAARSALLNATEKQCCPPRGGFLPSRSSRNTDIQRNVTYSSAVKNHTWKKYTNIEKTLKKCPDVEVQADPRLVEEIQVS